MTTPAPRTWIYFLSQADFNQIGSANSAKITKINRYHIDSVAMIRGESVTDFKPGAEIVRLNASEPLDNCAHALAGCTQHLHYTSDVQRDRLLAISLKEIPASEQPLTVLIPIRKADSWWNLGHNTRWKNMNGSASHRGHNAIGEDYAPQIFRQLIHSRYVDSSKRPYDFLTYFEFPASNREAFQSLLHKLRDETLNPEWAHVEMEQELWMLKIG